MSDPFRAALDELSAVFDCIDRDSIETACRHIIAARRIMLYGCGREGLHMQGFAMRLNHLGFAVCMQGDMAAFPLEAGDLFIVTAGPGELSTVSALCGVAKRAGASILLLTAVGNAPVAAIADQVLRIPAQTMASDRGAVRTSVLPMGSLYEGALFVLFEVMVLRLAKLTGATAGTMRARHTNME